MELNLSIQFRRKNKVLVHNALLLVEKQHLTGYKWSNSKDTPYAVALQTAASVFPMLMHLETTITLDKIYREKIKRFLNKMPNGKDCIKRDNGT